LISACGQIKPHSLETIAGILAMPPVSRSQQPGEPPADLVVDLIFA
jgi:hypothetical protein